LTKKILLVEDEQTVRNSIKELLENINYTVFSAPDGKEGLQLATEIKPDLIISDIMMPHLDGFGLIKAVRENPSVKNVPFIFLTAKAEISDFREGMDLGADDYIVKPFRAVKLLELIENKLARFDSLRNSPGIEPEEQLKEKKSSLTENDKLFLTVKNKPQIIRIGDILFIKAEGEYSNIHLVSGVKILKRKLIKEWEQQLPSNIFLRIHRATIINLNHLSNIERWYNRSYVIFLKNYPEKFIVSQRYASRIRARFVL
jgi:DNA-binding LytR/AlgR family response regulator